MQNKISEAVQTGRVLHDLQVDDKTVMSAEFKSVWKGALAHAVDSLPRDTDLSDHPGIQQLLNHGALPFSIDASNLKKEKIAETVKKYMEEELLSKKRRAAEPMDKSVSSKRPRAE